MTEGRAEFMSLAGGAARTQALFVAAKLGIADTLRDGPKRSAELAQACGANPDALARLMRALVSIGVFSGNDTTGFALTAISELLRSDTADSLRPYAIMQGEQWVWRSWGEIAFSLRTGRAAFEHVFGAPLFDYYTTHPDAGRVSAAALDALSKADNDAIARAYAFPDQAVVVDVAGGRGSLLATILARHALLRGILFERAALREAADGTFASAGLQDRCTIVSGDFFSEVPAGGDFYLLKKVLHDWDDERALAILRRCRAAMNASSRLLIAEFVLPDHDGPSPAKWLDMLMLVYAGGRERSQAEYGQLLAAAGFALDGPVATGAAIGLLEARPV